MVRRHHEPHSGQLWNKTKSHDNDTGHTHLSCTATSNMTSLESKEIKQLREENTRLRLQLEQVQVEDK